MLALTNALEERVGLGIGDRTSKGTAQDRSRFRGRGVRRVVAQRPRQS